MMFSYILQQAERIGSPLLGIIIPAVILIIASILTWLLYKRFAGK